MTDIAAWTTIATGVVVFAWFALFFVGERLAPAVQPLVPTGLPAGLERMLALVIVTPGIHWVHHHAARADTDSNYGTLFSFWDRIIRTRSPTRRMPTMAIGVEGEDERALPVLLARPFRRRR